MANDIPNKLLLLPRDTAETTLRLKAFEGALSARETKGLPRLKYHILQ